jgi:TPR repeat protein
MRKMHKPFLFLAALLAISLATPALARDGAEIAKVFDAGVTAYDAGNYEQAFKIWWDLQFEDVAAMRNLGMMLRKGQGTAKDPKRAEEIYQRAAEAGLPTAQADLADMLLKGEAGPPDLERALPLLQAAAAANHPVAQFQLGQLYETGAPPLVLQNKEVARQLYTAAASHGMKEAAARAAFLGPPAVNSVQATGPAPAPQTAAPVAIPDPPPLSSPPAASP